MITKKFFVLLCAMCLTYITARAQNPTVQNGVATYHSDKNIGRKFKVPESWDKILIKENVTITGSFYFSTRTRPMEIAGESRVTSVIKGDGSRPTNDGINGRSYSAIRFDKSPNVYIHDLRSLNPMKFHIGGGFGSVLVERCDLIENRGAHSSDGIHGGNQNVIVRDCYISTYDDALYTRECTLVENTTIVHNKNGAPFMTSWGAGIDPGSQCIIRNCTVIDNYHIKDGYNHGVFGWANKNSDNPQTINVKLEGTFTYQVAPGKVAGFMYSIGRWGGNPIKNATIRVDGICPGQNSVLIRPGAQNCKVVFVNCDAPTGNPTANAGPNQTVADLDANGSETVSLDGSGSNDADGTITSYVWSKGGSQIATGVSPNVTLAVGTHNITLTVTDNDGLTDTDVVTIKVTGLATIPGKIEAEDYSTMSGIQTQTTSDVGGGLNVGWIDVGDWLDYDVNVLNAGTYTVKFRVASASENIKLDLKDGNTVLTSVNEPTTGGWQNWTTVSKTIELTAGVQTLRVEATGSSWNFNWLEFDYVGPQPPVANAGPDQSVNDSDNNGTESVTLDGSASTDDGSIVSYVWTEGGSQIATGATPVVSLPVGTNTLTLTVTDNDGLTDSDQVTITVNPFVPIPPVANAGPDQTVNDTDEDGVETVTLDGSGSSDADGTITSYVWSEGGSQIATGVSPSITLAVGTHNITLTVTDNDGETDTDNVTITVNSGCVQCPYAANTVPGTIEAEEYDLGGQGLAYNDNDAANKGNAGFRTDEGVDLDQRSGLISIGWCAAGEWSEYTLDVQQSGTYKVFYSFATNANTNPKSFSFAINGTSIGTVNIAGNDPINNVGNSVFETRELGDISLSAGTNILRWTAGSNAISFDKVIFEYQQPADVTPPSVPTGLSATGATETTVELSWNASTDSESGVAGYRVYQDGQQVADIAGLSTTISNLVCDNSYSFTASAYDNAGNESSESAAELATTSACAPIGDYIYIGHVASGNRLGASTGGVDTRPASNTGANVQWEEVATDGAYFYLVNVATGQRLNAPTKQTINMVGSGTTGNTAQWQWVAQGGGEYFLQSREWGKYFHIAADGVSDISTKWNTNLAGIVWTITAVPKSAEATILTDNSVNIYPNPASSLITIELGELQDYASVEIYNSNGQLELSKTLKHTLEAINLEQLNSGMYIVKINNNNNISTKTLIVK